MAFKPQKNIVDAADQAMHVAVGHHQAGRLAAAEQAYHDVLKINWAHGDALRLLGGLYLQLNQPERAATTLKQAAQTLPTNAEIVNNLGVALRNQNKFDEAIQYFEQALRLKPDYVEALNNLGHAYHSTGKPSTGIALYEKAVRIKPDYVKGLCNLGAALRDLGRQDEALARQESALKIAPSDPDLLHDYALTLQKSGRLTDAISFYEQTLKRRPDFFAALSNYGSALRELNQTDAAQAQYEKALRIAPNRPEIFINFAAIFWDMNQLDRAVECYDKALAIDPNQTEALVNYGSVLWAQGRPDAALEKYQAALRLKPDHATAYANMGALRHDVADWDGALNLYEKALRIDPMHAHARFAKSLIQLAYGQYNEGWKLYESGLGVRMLRGLHQFASRPWNGIASPNTRLVIWSEQGLGDSLQFIRYAKLCRERVGKVIVLCPKPLQRLLKNCEGVDEVCDTITANQFDEHIAMLSLPNVFGTTLTNLPARVPYLFAEPTMVAPWAARFADVAGFKIGLVWAGNARENKANANIIDRRRSLHLQRLLPLLDVPNATFISLQMGPPAEQIDALNLRDRILDPMGEVTDFADTAAIIESLDLIISVDTSVAHLAGGLGKPVWILSRYDACWRWLRNRSENPWYPTAKIFGQPTLGDWDSVIENVRVALAATVTDSAACPTADDPATGH